MPNIDVMKAVQDVESVPTVRARLPPSPKVKDKGPPLTSLSKKKSTTKTKKAKKATDSVIFGVIGNPNKMSEKPKPDGKKKKKKSKFYDSSDGSLTSLSSFGGGSIDSMETSAMIMTPTIRQRLDRRLTTWMKTVEGLL